MLTCLLCDSMMTTSDGGRLFSFSFLSTIMTRIACMHARTHARKGVRQTRMSLDMGLHIIITSHHIILENSLNCRAKELGPDVLLPACTAFGITSLHGVFSIRSATADISSHTGFSSRYRGCRVNSSVVFVNVFVCRSRCLMDIAHLRFTSPLPSRSRFYFTLSFVICIHATKTTEDVFVDSPAPFPGQVTLLRRSSRRVAQW